jgi:hypothetical protein
VAKKWKFPVPFGPRFAIFSLVPMSPVDPAGPIKNPSFYGIFEDFTGL